MSSLSARLARSEFWRASGHARIVLVLLVAWIVVVIFTAWVSDDAFITLRTIDNLLNGHGLRWNVDERVQSYTHPLWMALEAITVALIKRPFLSAALLGIVTSTAVAIAFWRWIALSNRLAAVGLLTFLVSRAFVDYATSGLENPLIHLLLVWFCAVWWRQADTPGRTGRLSLICALILLTRVDAALLILPALIMTLLRQPFRRRLAAALLGLLPFLLWEVFSVIYYGVPFPNTAYAKLGAGVPRDELLQQGGHYFLRALQWDPITLAVMAIAVAAALQRSMRRYVPLCAGIVLYCGYVWAIGGDFMAGRFFTAPFLCGVLVLSRWPALDRRAADLAAPVVAALLWMTPSLFADPGLIDAWEIADERLYYAEGTALRTQSRWPLERHRQVIDGLERRNQRLFVWGAVGMTGLYAGPGAFIVDRFALTDPLLARLPAFRDWRPGHFERRIPPGYLETLEDNANRLVDPKLAAYYDKLRILTRAPLWTRNRFETIIRFNLGEYDNLLAGYARTRLSLPSGCLIPDDRTVEEREWPVPERGIDVQLGGSERLSAVLVTLSSPPRTGRMGPPPESTYRIVLMDGVRPVFEKTILVGWDVSASVTEVVAPDRPVRFDHVLIELSRDYHDGKLLQLCLAH